MVYAKESVKNLPEYKPARSIAEVSRKYGFPEKDLIKLAGNENRWGCSPNVLKAINDNNAFFSYYPDVNATRLREKLVEKHNVSGENLIFGNGSFELLTLIGEVYIGKGDEVIYTDPSFGWYLNVTLKNEGTVIKVPVTDRKGVDTKGILAQISDRTKVIWLCNPNNPTGTVIPPDELISFVDKVPKNVLIVLDEAYIDFIDGEYIDTVDLVKNHDNVISLRTFSKTYGLASFRIGYGIASKDIIKNLLKVKLPININYAAQIAALAAMEDKEFFDNVIKSNRKELKYYYKEFDSLGLKFVPSNGNFVLVYTGIDGEYVENEFAKSGIIIRKGEEFGLDGWLRISVGRSEENIKVIDILKKILSEAEKK
ncbi:MAG: histidinol-phosphate transaminase [Butyrivibrio sp.]|nr:histidinol-phosphate transaminase [Butyrivibrio sp.]